MQICNEIPLCTTTGRRRYLYRLTILEYGQVPSSAASSIHGPTPPRPARPKCYYLRRKSRQSWPIHPPADKPGHQGAPEETKPASPLIFSSSSTAAALLYLTWLGPLPTAEYSAIFFFRPTLSQWPVGFRSVAGAASGGCSVILYLGLSWRLRRIGNPNQLPWAAPEGIGQRGKTLLVPGLLFLFKAL